jgi:hypothetical protein
MQNSWNWRFLPFWGIPFLNDKPRHMIWDGKTGYGGYGIYQYDAPKQYIDRNIEISCKLLNMIVAVPKKEPKQQADNQFADYNGTDAYYGITKPN